MNSPSDPELDPELSITRTLAPRRRRLQNNLRICGALSPIITILLMTCVAHGQSAPTDKPGSRDATQQDSPPKSGSTLAPQTDSKSDSKQQAPAAAPSGRKQKERRGPGRADQPHLGVMPNYRAVSADTILPPLSVRGKFVLATHDSLDYTSGLFAGLSGMEVRRALVPGISFGVGRIFAVPVAAFADQAIGNYFTEAIVPSVLHEDPRYYTLGHGSVLHRTEYAITRLVVTKTDSGKTRFNYSEILGNGMAAGVSDLYYPSQERTFTKTTETGVRKLRPTESRMS